MSEFGCLVCAHNKVLSPKHKVILILYTYYFIQACYWGEPERAPHRRVECSQSIYYYGGTSVTRAPRRHRHYTSVRDIFHVRDIFRMAA